VRASSDNTICAAGFPHIGRERELKFALEKFWEGEITDTELLETARTVEADAWQAQIDARIDHIGVGDFALYGELRMPPRDGIWGGSHEVLPCVRQTGRWTGSSTSAVSPPGKRCFPLKTVAACCYDSFPAYLTGWHKLGCYDEKRD
jgi:hypothetical protein